jgi:hypothetical protein
MNYINKLTSLILITVFLTACTGSGDSTEEQPNIEQPIETGYQGPPPSNDDVSSFKTHIWDNLVNKTCGDCHNQEIGQTPQFVRTDDVNLAYQEANPIIDLNDPGASRIVEKVAGGHNCWESQDSVCADNITRWIENWAGDSGVGEANEIELVAPSDQDPGATRSFPSDPSLFETTIYPVLQTYCAGCHSDSSPSPQSPFFARDDVAAAYDAVKSKIDLDTPSNSRLVVRLRSEFHNCWSDCPANATEMQEAVESFQSQIEIAEVDPSWVLSKALRLTDGLVASSGGRHETNVIGLWSFKTGEGNTAFDTSGVEPSLHLNLMGDVEWVGGWGVRIRDGRAQGVTADSRKLYDLITSTGEFSVEGWVVPGNVTQEGPARIASYSGAADNTNFVLGQTLYNYDFLLRSSVTQSNGMPALSTPNADEVLQATLQHVVVTYKSTEGRKIYVNGELIVEEAETVGASFNDWDPSFAFVLGNEVSGNRLWEGVLRMVAVHNRVLTPEQITQNFDAGVGEKFFLLFNVSAQTGVEMAYILFEVSQFDSYSYLFSQPHFVSLADNPQIDNVVLKNMRIGINGKEASVGQAYAKLDTVLSENGQTTVLGQPLSGVGTIIGLEQGPTEDQFFLSFEQLGEFTNVRVEADLPATEAPADGEPAAQIGLRTFDEINQSYSELTTIPVNQADVQATFNQVRQALPVTENVNGFLSSQQMGITQLAIEYCNVLVEDSAKATAFFGNFDFDADPSVALNSAGRTQIIDALTTKIVGSGVATQPQASDVSTELDSLITRLTQCTSTSSCESNRTKTVVKSVCAATLGSAVVLIQ